MGGGAGQRRARSVLVVAEIAVTLVLTIGAALLIRSFARLQQVASGFDARRALAVDVPLSSVRYGTDEARTAAVDRVLERLAAAPGVVSAAVTTQLPMAGSGSSIYFNIKGRPQAAPDRYALAGYRAVSHGYFRTLGIGIRRGREFTASDREGAPRAIVVNETMSRQFFHGEDPIGQHIQLGALPDPSDPWMEIVGIVGDVRQGADIEPKAEMYVPYAQYPLPLLRRLYANVTLVVRTADAPGPIAGIVRGVVRDMDREQPVTNVRTMDDVLAASVAQPRFRTLLLGLFALIAMTLAGIGVYGLLAHGVLQRTNEFGLRMALGAQPEEVLRLVLSQGVRLAAAGVAIGIAAAVPLVQVLTSVLFAVTPWDPFAWAASILTLMVVSVLASWLPAKRAVQTDPVIALRA